MRHIVRSQRVLGSRDEQDRCLDLRDFGYVVPAHTAQIGKEYANTGHSYSINVLHCGKRALEDDLLMEVRMAKVSEYSHTAA